MKYHTIPRYRLYEADVKGFASTHHFVVDRLIKAGFDMSRPIDVQYHSPTNSSVYSQED